ncbi:hypothetical protein ACFRKE_30495, partial [Kitasatospora indigofera]
RGPQADPEGPLAAAGPGASTRSAGEPSGASGRPAQPRARRFVFAAAAAGAFSVAAVTLGGVGGLPTPAGDDRPGTAVTPARGPAGVPVPMSGQVPVDFPVLPVAATRTAAAPGDSGRLPAGGSPYGGAPYNGGFHGGPYGDGPGQPR